MMRQLLEASWNVDSMGIVPSTPESAAEAAGKFSNGNIETQVYVYTIKIMAS